MNECSSSPVPKWVEKVATAKREERRMWNHCPWQNVMETQKTVTQNECWYSSFANQKLFYGRNGRVINPNKTQTPKGNNWKLNPDFTLPSIFRIAHIPIWSMAKTRRSARTSAGWSRWAGEWLFGNTFQHHNESHLHKMEILTTFTAFVGHSSVKSGNSKLGEAWGLFIKDVKGKLFGQLLSSIVVDSFDHII